MDGSGNLALAEWMSWPVPCTRTALSASTRTRARREATTESGSKDAFNTSARPIISAFLESRVRHQAGGYRNHTRRRDVRHQSSQATTSSGPGRALASP